MIVANGMNFDSLKEVQSWAFSEQPNVVNISAGGTISAPATRWKYSCPGGLHIDGGLWKGYGAKGWWLAYTPEAPSGGLFIRRATVTGYQAGGISVAPAVNVSTSQAGISAWINSVEISDCYFGNLQGLGGMYLRGVSNLVVRKSKFKQIGSAWTAHAIYANDSTRGIVSDCEFKYVYGDPVRARDGSSLIVSRSQSYRSGRNGLSSTWTKPGEKRSKIIVIASRATLTYDGHKAVEKTDIRGKRETY